MADVTEFKKTWKLDCPRPCEGECELTIKFIYDFNDAGACTKCRVVFEKKRPDDCTADHVVGTFEVNHWLSKQVGAAPVFIAPGPVPQPVPPGTPPAPWVVAPWPTAVTLTGPPNIEIIVIDIEWDITCSCGRAPEEGPAPEATKKRVRARSTYASGSDPTFSTPQPD